MQPHAGLEHMEVQRVDAQFWNNAQKFRQRIRDIGGWYNNGHATHKMEFFPGFAIKAVFAFCYVVRENPYEFIAQLINGGKAHNINACKALPERLKAQDVGHPVGKIIGRLRRQIMVLLQEPMGMIINCRRGNLLDVLKQFSRGFLPSLPAAVPGAVQRKNKMAQARASSSRIVLISI